MDRNNTDAKNGFTLIETSIILLITASLIVLPIISLEHIIKTIQVDLSLRELETNITMMQNNALLADQRSEVWFYPSQNMVQFRTRGENITSNYKSDRKMYLEDEIVKIDGDSYSKVSFQKGSGNIVVENSKHWTTNFTTAQGKYELVFQLGSGRFEIRKK